MNLNLPEYVKVNGGQINIVFSPLSVYYDGGKLQDLVMQAFHIKLFIKFKTNVLKK
jgi:hypothetical protein